MLDTITNAAALLPQHPTDHRGCRGNATPRWCVAQTQPQAERWANQNLQRLGYRTYLPLYAIQRRDRSLPSLRHTVLVPLFPRYLFIQHDNPDLWRPIREAPGVASVLTCGNRIQYASPGAVEAILAGDELRRTTPTSHTAAWRPGAVCRVGMGIFQGHPGVVTIVANDTAIVSLMFLGHLREISLPLDCLTSRSDA